MQTRTLTASGLAVLGLFALIATTSCEDTGVTAPEGSTITLVALPANISIDQDAGANAGATTLRAQLLDSSGLPQRDVPLSFTTTGGVLASISNICVDLDEPDQATCLKSGGACTNDGDCPIVPPEIQETDINGIVTDLLVLRLFQDPESVEVTVQSTASMTAITVGTNVNTGPEDPKAVLEARPENRALNGSPVTFDGSNSTFALTSRITCFRFAIEARSGMNETVFSTSPTITRTYGTPGQPGADDLTVTLSVSDQTNTTCEPGATIDFSQFQDVLSYQVRCDFPGGLTVNGGPNKSATLIGGSATVILNATASDDNLDEEPTFLWDCGNQTTSDLQNGSCTYTSTNQGQPFQATVTATNSCGRSVTDSVLVTINP